MREILLINPNTSVDTTAMMVAIAQTCAPNGYMVSGATAARGVSMILDAERLQDASEEVIESWKRHRGELSGIVISAFGDPGIDMLRALTDVPIAGIFEASLFEAAQGDRPFGIATVTPDLADAIDANVQKVGLGRLYTGIRLTQGDPMTLVSDPARLEAALADAVARCIADDGARAVVIGGGPLGQAAVGLAHRFSVPVIAPISAAMRRISALLTMSS
jgi:allantoin racemase